MHKKLQRPFKRHAPKLKHAHRHPFIVPVITFFVLFFISAVFFVGLGANTIGPSDSHIVHLFVDGKEETLPSRAATVGDLLQRTGITLGAHDVVEPAAATAINDDNFDVNVYRSHPVTITDGGQPGQQATTTNTYTAQQSPAAIAKAAGYTIYPEDKVVIKSPDNVTQQGIDQEVVIDRAVPVHLNLYGTQIDLRTQSKTVGALLTEKGIKLQPGDTVAPVSNTAIATDSQIFVLNQNQHIITVSTEIPNQTQTTQDPNTFAGVTTVQQQGRPGTQLTTYEIEVNAAGQEVSRHQIQQVIVVQPVTQIVVQGTKVDISGDKGAWLAEAGISPSDYNAVDFIVSHESGWCPTKWQGEHSCTTYHGVPGAGLGYGLCQSTPGSKMASAGADWASNPVTQLEWCTSYAKRTYGGWQQAYNVWVLRGWW